MVGTVLALAALSFVLYPLLAGTSGDAPVDAPTASRNPSRSQAVDALREIEFDRATGKLSDSDYTALKSSYTQQAVDAMRGGTGVICERCGPRPEVDARFCSSCGLPL